MAADIHLRPPHTRSCTTPLRGEQRFQHSGFEWGDQGGLREEEDQEEALQGKPGAFYFSEDHSEALRIFSSTHMLLVPETLLGWLDAFTGRLAC